MGAAVGLMLGGGITQALSAVQQGEAAERAAKINARRIGEENFQRELELHEKSRRIAGKNRTLLAKSGVRAEGSPNDFLARNELNTLRMKQRIRRSTRVAQNTLRNQGRFARDAGRMNAFATLTGSMGRSLLYDGNPLLAAFGSQGGGRDAEPDRD